MEYFYIGSACRPDFHTLEFLLLLVLLVVSVHVTSQGPKRITIEIPHLEAHILCNLRKYGIVMAI